MLFYMGNEIHISDAYSSLLSLALLKGTISPMPQQSGTIFHLIALELHVGACGSFVRTVRIPWPTNCSVGRHTT